MRATIQWLRARANDVAVALLAAMFVSFALQIFTRYVINAPLGWTLELCLTTWLWLVFWSAAFILEDRDHVKFDVLYLAAGFRVRRIMAFVSALAILAGFLAALPGTFDYIMFYKIKHSATLGIRLDVVFSVYGIFAVATIVRYALRVWTLARGRIPEEPDMTVQP